MASLARNHNEVSQTTYDANSADKDATEILSSYGSGLISVPTKSIDILLQSHAAPPQSRGLHSSSFQLNLSVFYGIGGARRGCVAREKRVLGGEWGV